MKKDLNRNTRGVNHYLHFKSDFKSDSNRLFDSLPLFFRIMYLDQPNPWIHQINRFDFLRLATVSSEFEYYQKIQFGDFEYRKIKPTHPKEINEIELSEFLSTSILRKEDIEYSVQEFILCLAYSGGIHMTAEKNGEKVNLLYSDLFLRYPDFCFDLTKSLSKVFLDIFDELYSLLVGDNNGHSPNVNYQAKIAINGKTIEGILFERAYMQFPIRVKKNKGIRFCLDLKFNKIEGRNPILYYGHRKNNALQAMIWQQGSKLIFKVSAQNENKSLSIDLSLHFERFTLVEFAIYPNGKISISINEILKTVDDLSQKIDIIDGKAILGANLNGSEFGQFSQRAIVIQSIDKTDMTRNLGIYALRKLDIYPQRLPYNMIARKI